MSDPAASEIVVPNPWNDSASHPGLLRCWDATALRLLMQCPRRFFYKQVKGWRPRPRAANDNGSVHRDFGTMVHACFELYDRQRLAGADHESALDAAVSLALEMSWTADTDQPWGGVALDEWRCRDGKVVNLETGRKIKCPATKDWWGGAGAHECPKCGGDLERRHAYIPTHQTKHRLNLLRAVVAYCDEQADGGIKPTTLEDGTPALEIRFELDLPRTCPDGRPYVLCGHLDRISEFGDGTIFIHERKTTTRGLGRDYWGGFAPDPQVDTYDWAAHRLYLRHEGVIVEAVQVLREGVRIARSIVTRNPQSREEWEREVLELILLAETCAWSAGQYPTAQEKGWPRNTASCGQAAGGMPCEFRDVCAAAPAVRARLLEAGFEQQEIWNPMGETGA